MQSLRQVSSKNTLFDGFARRNERRQRHKSSITELGRGEFEGERKHRGRSTDTANKDLPSMLQDKLQMSPPRNQYEENASTGEPHRSAATGNAAEASETPFNKSIRSYDNYL